MKIIRTFSITLSLFVVIICGINLFDRELRSEVQQIVNVVGSLKENAELGRDNAYFAVLGFKAPEGMDIEQAGKRVHTEYYSWVTNNTLDIPSSPESIIGPSPSFINPADIPQCKPDEPDCLAYYKLNREKRSQLLQENTLLLERYTQLKTYSGFQDLMRYNPWTSWADLSPAIYAAHVLSIAEAAYLFHDGRKQDAIDRVVEDIVLWRKFLTGTADIASKTYSMLALMRSYTLLENMAALLPQDAGELNVAGEILDPLNEEEKSYGLVIDGYIQALHWDLVHHLAPLTKKKMNLVSNYFFKANATQNEAYDIFNSMKLVSEAAPDRLNQEKAILEKKILHAEKKSIDMIYNPLGKIFLATSFESGVAVQWNNTSLALDEKITSLRERMSQQGNSIVKGEM